jgi:fatty-acid desaturase
MECGLILWSDKPTVSTFIFISDNIPIHIHFIAVAGWVIAVIVVVILLVAAGIGGGVTGYLVWHFCCSHRASQ